MEDDTNSRLTQIEIVGIIIYFYFIYHILIK